MCARSEKCVQEVRNVCKKREMCAGSEKFMQEVRSFHPEEGTCPPRASVQVEFGLNFCFHAVHYKTVTRYVVQVDTAV
jgi:hypothetical protein